MKIICAAEASYMVAVIGEEKRFQTGQAVQIIEGEFRGGERWHVTKKQQRVGIVIESLLTICTAYIPPRIS